MWFHSRYRPDQPFISIITVTWKLWGQYSPATQQFVQQFVRTNNKENVKVLHRWPYVRACSIHHNVGVYHNSYIKTTLITGCIREQILSGAVITLSHKNDISYGTSVTEELHESELIYKKILTIDIPYLVLTGELWGVYCEDFQEKSPRYNATVL